IERLKDADYEKAVTCALSMELEQAMELNAPKEQITEYEKILSAVVERERAGFSAWYEFFPRSWNKNTGKHGTFTDCELILPEISRMGFDVIYLPPIHPIAETKRKGKNNSVICESGDPGSPWAIGAEQGGHKSIHPELGTLADFNKFVKMAGKLGMEVAIDMALQCSWDHPYIKEHPEWFRWRPDKTIQFAENPPKKYEDIVPLNFEIDSYRELWLEIKSIFEFWINQGIRILRVDNPHTKPFVFWEWLIKEIIHKYPDVIFLSEAFTRPKVMYRLAKLGFTQSYTYFSWRNTKHEFIEYLTELTRTQVREFFRPNFWPNTPDILAESLQYNDRPAFIIRLVLAATLSSNYGLYGPAFELCINEPVPGREEYLNSEQYEIKNWNWDASGNIKDIMAKINLIRKENKALQTTCNLVFFNNDNDKVLSYMKATGDLSNIIMVIVNLDHKYTQSGWVFVPVSRFGIKPDEEYQVNDVLNDNIYTWKGEKNYFELNPGISPAHIFRVQPGKALF
ncbi:MAG: alpha-amylase family glycosyl hydrolase, partial [bacterium]